MKKRLKSLAIVVAFLAGAATASALDISPPEYKKLSNLVGQGYEWVKAKDGSYLSCIYFYYDRNSDSDWQEGYFRGRDLIEYRVLKVTDQGYMMWEDNPYIVIIDDDFDGVADREFVDHERDGVFDEVNDLSDKKLSMDDFPHKTYRK